MIKAVFWDFGGVITSSPFESFNRFEKENDLPKDFLRLVNSTNPDSNAWAKLERNEVNLDEFNKLFEIESKNLGHPVKGKDVIALLRGQVRPEMIAAWAKENGIRGFEMYDPQYRDSLKRKSSQKKRFNKSVTFKRRGR